MTENAEPQCSITAKQWDTVAVWSWDVRVETCAICKSTIADLCIECRGVMDLGRSAVAADHNSKNNQSSNSVDRTVGGPSTGLGSYAAAADLHQHNHNDGISDIAGGVGSSINSNSSSGGVAGDCLLVWGVCNHVFHAHCLSRWVRQRPVCPICGREWEVYKTTRND
ncbi:uncharacterized protein TM35_000281070 [Trypanosoma theileri]|uniref:RING-type domain-containing protein n=1 Tax=Trypanosoma theileri TaxID=67003 RepID=A0A1X0NP59_9TRYP|nr:uncharacterized protein TM35_000281070 [Trypanosoma theileri]ORC86391.1 hypothetical protein TM35_000281070 [Trypanosoma theileri]